MRPMATAATPARRPATSHTKARVVSATSGDRKISACWKARQQAVLHREVGQDHDGHESDERCRRQAQVFALRGGDPPSPATAPHQQKQAHDCRHLVVLGQQAAHEPR